MRGFAAQKATSSETVAILEAKEIVVRSPYGRRKVVLFLVTTRTLQNSWSPMLSACRNQVWSLLHCASLSDRQETQHPGHSGVTVLHHSDSGGDSNTAERPVIGAYSSTSVDSAVKLHDDQRTA